MLVTLITLLFIVINAIIDVNFMVIMKKTSSKRTSPPPVDVLRCVRSPEGRLIADFYGKLPCTKPLWLGTRPDMLRRAVAHDLASAWFGEPTVADGAFMTQVQEGAERAAFAALPMIHKSGGCVLGLESVMQALEAGALKCVIIATDAGRSDQKKLINNPDHAPFCTAFGTRAQLGAAFGRRAQVFIGIRHGLLAKKLAFFLRCNTGFL